MFVITNTILYSYILWTNIFDRIFNVKISEKFRCVQCRIKKSNVILNVLRFVIYLITINKYMYIYINIQTQSFIHT